MVERVRDDVLCEICDRQAASGDGPRHGSIYDAMEGMSAVDWSQCAEVERVPGKMGGVWILRGTRVPADQVVDNFESGASADDIVEWFVGLKREQVQAVIDFACVASGIPHR